MFGLRGRTGLVAVLALGGVILPAHAPALAQESVTNLPHRGILAVRAPGQLDIAIIDAIADVGAEQVVKFSAFDDVADFISRKCGKPSIAVPVHPRYRDKLIAQNSSAAAADPDPLQLTEDRTLKLPACASRFALQRAEFDAPNGLQALMQRLAIPFDIERYRRLTSAPNFKVAVADEYLRLTASPYPDGQVCGAPDLLTYFGCVNAIETAFVNRDRIKNTDQIVGKVRIFVTPVDGMTARVPIAADKAAQFATVAILSTDSEKNQYQSATGITNITLMPPAAATTAAQPIKGVGELRITAAAPPASSDGSAVPPQLPLAGPRPKPQVAPAVLSAAAAPVSATIENDVKFVTAVDDLTRFDPGCTDAHETNKGRWPFDPQEFMRVLALSFDLDPGQVETPRVLVVDTGFDFTHDDNKTPPAPEKFIFPKDSFATNRDKNNSVADGIQGDHFGAAGVNLAMRSRSSSTHVLDMTRRRSHGLAVTTLALGGRDLQYLRGLKILKTKVGIASLVPTNNVKIVLNQDHIQRIMRYATASTNDFKVINLSLSTRDDLQGFQDQMKNEGKRVFVAAAGNDETEGKPLHEDEHAIYPAALGGEPKAATLRDSVVITVGAHMGNGKRAGFSYFSDSKVDLLAPGCMVPSYELRKTGDDWVDPPRVVESFVSGTSFAAPLVSFFISVLMTDVALAEPGIVKERVLVGTDFDFGLISDAYSSGRLNPSKMLSAGFDVLETLIDGKRRIRFGLVTNKAALPAITCGGAPVPFKDVRKLALDERNSQVLLMSNRAPAVPSSLKKGICAPSALPNVNYLFNDVETGETDLPFNAATQVVDYISRR